jgi:hypothetical protein
MSEGREQPQMEGNFSYPILSGFYYYLVLDRFEIKKKS